MRFEYIGLERFGQFERLSLHLPSDRPLVVIHGPNEAGKTTLLRAIHDLLFGVSERSPYGFRLDLRAMSIRARLRDRAGHSLELQRFKRRKDSLVGVIRDGPEERPASDAALREYLRGVDRELYSSLFGFTRSKTLRRPTSKGRTVSLRWAMNWSDSSTTGIWNSSAMSKA